MDNVLVNKLFYVDKNYSGIKELDKNDLDIRSFNILGKINLWSGNLKEACEYFNKSGYTLGCAYCNLMEEKFSEADTLLKPIKESSSAANWLLCLTNILKDENLTNNPTYFQIRNFYEQDLNMFFLYKRNTCIEKLINKNPYFERINREIYKYSARVLLNNNCLKTAEKLLKKSLDIFYKDSETHYMLGELYYMKKEFQKAKNEYLKANQVNCGYKPAINKLSKFNN